MRVIVSLDSEVLAGQTVYEIISGLSKTPEGVTPNLGLSGGSSPVETYRLMVQTAMNWTNLNMWLVDERWVPHDHERSNGKMISELLPVRYRAQLLRPPWNGEIGPHVSAQSYWLALQRKVLFGRAPQVVLLGMGEDGHTASLFPGSSGLGETQSGYFANQIPETGEWRLTASYPLLLSSATILVLVSGESKAEIVARVLEDKDQSLPITKILAAEGELVWLLDRAAASKLTKTKFEE